MADNTYSIYMHTSPSGKVYIGVTGQIPEYRWNGGRGYVANPHFHSAITKYGWGSFRHEILHSGLAREEAYEIEKALIARYDSTNSAVGYNMSSGGMGGKLGWKASDATRAKMSDSGKAVWSRIRKEKVGSKNYTLTQERRDKIRLKRLGTSHTDETKQKISKTRIRHKVVQADLNETPIKTWASVCEAAQFVGVSSGKISECCTGRRKTVGGYKWFYADGVSPRKFNAPFRKNTSSMIPVIQFTKDGKKVAEWESISAAGQGIGIHHSVIAKCAKGKLHTAGGYVWVYANEVAT